MAQGHPGQRRPGGHSQKNTYLFVLYAAHQRVTCDDHAFYEAVEARVERASADRAEDDMGEEFDFDDPHEMRRRLPRLAQLFLGERE